MRSGFVFPPLKCLRQTILLVKGNAIKITINENRLFYRREKTIPISDINYVEIRRKPGYYPVGYIELSVKGDKLPSRFVFKGKKSYETALKIKEYISRRVYA